MNYFTHDNPTNKSENFKIRQIPHLVAPLKISQLNFSHNQIRSIPPHIKAACNLHILDLSHNKISKVEHIFHMKSLKFINLSHNLISELPPQIVSLVQIENFDLSFNKIKIMSSIKVLKNLFQLRMLQYKGFLEINLQGNEVLKKKGCKESYQKWKSPTVQEFSSVKKMLNESISRTQKRNAKSVELPFRQKESELIHTNRTFLVPQSSKIITSFKLTEGSSMIRNNDVGSKPHQMTQKLKSIPFTSQSEQLKENKELKSMSSKEMNLNEQISRMFNFKDMSILSQQNKDNNNLKEWFNNCINQLKNLLQMFQLIIDNEDFNKMQTIIKQKMIEESLLAQDLIKLTIQAIGSQLNTDFQRVKQIHYAQRVESLFQQIRALHKEILNLLNQKQAHLIKLYKPWVVHYRKLKSLIASTSSKICAHKQNILRQKQIQQLVNISPQKSENIVTSQPKDQNVKSSAKRKQIDKLNQLLFSRTNDENLLLSEGKRSNSQKKTCKLDKEESECDSCLMSKWQVNKCKQEIAQLKEQLKLLSFQNQKLNKKIKELQTFKDKYLSLEAKQNLIIEELEIIQPSTYQNLMLQQAKTIEYMLSIQPMVKTDDISQFNRFRSKEIAPTSICTEKHLTGMNTRLSSNKQEKISTHNWKNKVSEFTYEPNQQKSTEKEGRSSSYFKNKVITTVNKTQKQSNQSNHNNGVSSNKFQIDERDRNKVIVSQFNSQANSIDNSQKKGDDARQKLISSNLSKGEILNSYKNVVHKQSLKVKKQKTQSDIILISEHSESKHSVSLKYSKKSSKIQEQSLLAKQKDIQNLVNKKLLKNNLSENSIQSHKQNDSTVANKFGGKIELKNINSYKKNKQSNSTNKIPQTNCLKQLNQVSKSAYQNTQKHFFQNKKYKDHGYYPMQSVQAENYKKYMQYYLRNNIIQILSKKGNLIPQNYDKKYLLLTKSQKLINKRVQTSRQFQKSTSRQKSSREISNTTLR